MSKSLLFVDHHEIVRIGLRHMLEGSEFAVANEASHADMGFDIFAAGKFDIVLIDVRLPGGDGLELLSRIKKVSPEQPVLMFSAYDNPTYIARAVALGANGFLLKQDSKERIISAIRKAASGENIWSREELRRVTGSLPSLRIYPDMEIPLTLREGEVLKQLANGLTNKEISQTLGISYETVKEHVQHILRKVGVSDRTQAAVWAVRRNLL